VEIQEAGEPPGLNPRLAQVSVARAVKTGMMRRVRGLAVLALIVVVPLLGGAVALARNEAAQRRAALDASLGDQAAAERARLQAYFGEARKLVTFAARSSDFTGFYAAPGTVADKLRAGGPLVERPNAALGAFEALYPDGIGEACFIDRAGPEVARAVRGKRAPVSDLSPDESGSAFFPGTFAIGVGQAYQARPYLSPDTGEWVISNSSPLPAVNGHSPAFVHFEVSLESFRRQAAAVRSDFELQVVDLRTGRVVFDAARPIRRGTKTLGTPASAWTRAVLADGARSGHLERHDRRAAYVTVAQSRGNQNRWAVVAVARSPLPSGIGAIGFGPLGMAIGALLLFAGLALVASFSRGVARRATGYAAVAERLGRGDLTETVAVDRDDELGALAASLNHLVETYLRRLAAAAERIAAGDLSEDVELASADDTLGRAFQRMTGSLRIAVGDVRRAAVTVAAASSQMASGSGEASHAVQDIAAAAGGMAQSSERQLLLLLGARTATEQAAAAAGASATTAAETAELAARARGVAEEGDAAAERASAAMHAVRDSTETTAAGIRRLAETSLRIGPIVGAISGIAEQTNLLALNAAIEAARAGEHGRGFAVVAEEVRSLAEEAGRAAQQIGGLIAEVQSGTTEVVALVEASGDRTAEGMLTVEETHQALRLLAEAVDGVSVRVATMARSADQIAADLEGLHSEIGEVSMLAEDSSSSAEQVSASTQETSATAQQLASGARDLSQTAGELERITQGFTLVDR
jgi:methyl-accepting chemotaxis protein